MIRCIAIVMFVVVAVVPCAWAADVEGTVRTVDTSERSITLDNGLKIWLPDGATDASVSEGAQVKISYEEKDGKPVATTIETK